jgi:hypothetical protein
MSGHSQGAVDFRDPGAFLHNIDPATGRAGFVRANRAALSAEPFLDHRWRSPDEATDGLPLSGLQSWAGEAPGMSFIWHTSACASTLLSACLDAPGRCLALKEPRALVILAALKQSGRLPDPRLAQAVFGLLGRRFEPDEQVLVKPSNSANTLIAEAAAYTRGRMLLLYSDCESFVLSMARQGRAGFAFVRDRFTSLAADGHPAARWPATQLFRLTDLELAALVWRMQMDAFEAASARLGDRARSLDCRLFLEDPQAVLCRIDSFLGLGIGRERIDEIASGPLFRRDAKAPGRSFDAKARAEERERLRAQLGEDLPAVLRGIESAFPHPPRLAQSVVAPDATPSGGLSAALAAPMTSV